MKYVLDTNVVSEMLRAEPNNAVMAFLRKHDAQCVITVMTTAELVYGVERLNDGVRKFRLRAQIDQVLALYANDMLSFDSAAAHRYGKLSATLASAGTSVPIADLVIASICLTNDATLVTRNVADFRHTAVAIVNPWDDNN